MKLMNNVIEKYKKHPRKKWCRNNIVYTITKNGVTATVQKGGKNIWFVRFSAIPSPTERQYKDQYYEDPDWIYLIPRDEVDGMAHAVEVAHTAYQEWIAAAKEQVGIDGTFMDGFK